MSKERVVIVGASPKPERYAYKAMQALLKHGHEVVLFNPTLPQSSIEGHPVVKSFKEVEGPVDTVTLYVGEKISATMAEPLQTLSPRRVIFNPGAENAGLEASLREANIHCQQACTLVLLATQQF